MRDNVTLRPRNLPFQKQIVYFVSHRKWKCDKLVNFGYFVWCSKLNRVIYTKNGSSILRISSLQKLKERICHCNIYMTIKYKNIFKNILDKNYTFSQHKECMELLKTFFKSLHDNRFLLLRKIHVIVIAIYQIELESPCI